MIFRALPEIPPFPSSLLAGDERLAVVLPSGSPSPASHHRDPCGRDSSLSLSGFSGPKRGGRNVLVRTRWSPAWRRRPRRLIGRLLSPPSFVQPPSLFPARSLSVWAKIGVAEGVRVAAAACRRRLRPPLPSLDPLSLSCAVVVELPLIVLFVKKGAWPPFCSLSLF